MASSTFTQAAVKESSWLGLALWRLSAGILYVSALLLVPRQLPAAVFLLLAALLCLPSSREAFHRHTGARVGAGLGASCAMALVLGAVLSGGWQAHQPISGVRATGGQVIVAAQARKR